MYITVLQTYLGGGGLSSNVHHIAVYVLCSSCSVCSMYVWAGSCSRCGSVIANDLVMPEARVKIKC